MLAMASDSAQWEWMDLPTTIFLFAVSAIVGLFGLVGVRFPPPPSHWRGWIPSHYMLLTGLAGMMCFGLHWLALVRAA
jgi:hypothetical protein